MTGLVLALGTPLMAGATLVIGISLLITFALFYPERRLKTLSLEKQKRSFYRIVESGGLFFVERKCWTGFNYKFDKKEPFLTHSFDTVEEAEEEISEIINYIISTEKKNRIAYNVVKTYEQ